MREAKAMSKALLASKTETSTVAVNPMIYDIGAAMDVKAQEVAATCDWLTSTINTIAKARQDYEGGPFAVMFKVRSDMPAEQYDALPDPNEEYGNNPGIYKIRTINAKGKPTVKEKKFYHVFSDRMPGNVAKQQRIDMLELSMKDPVQYNVSSVPKDIKDMDKDRRDAEISRLNGELSTSRTNVLAAFELLFALRAAHALPGVNVSIMYAVNDKGQLLDGEDGRDCVVENTKEPIYLVTTVEGREAKDNCHLSVTSFKKLRPAVAKERGGTYSALIESAPTIKRGTKTEDEPGGNKPDLINTMDKFQARTTDYHEYLDRVWSAKDKADYQELLKIVGPRGPAGSDDFALSLYSIFTCLGDLYRHDAVRARAEKLKEAEAITPLSKAS